MKKSAFGLCAVALCLGLFGSARASATQPYVIGYPMARPIFLTHAPVGVDMNRLPWDVMNGTTIPLWSGKVKAPINKQTYTFTMVGTSPQAKGTGTSSTITTDLYVYVFKFADNSVFDPTKGACGDSQSVVARTLASPLWQNSPIVSNGISVGNTQYEDAMQRAEFYKYTKTKPNYHLLYKDGGNTTVVNLTVPAADGNVYTGTNCNGKFGVVDINWFTSLVNSSSWQPTHIPIVFMYDVFMSGDGKIDQCCILGFHGAQGSPTQTYSFAAYNDPNIFSVPIEDVHALSHELGELNNDPTVNNATPLWGHIGQVGGCQGNLEVGDALTGTVFGPITLNGFTYHPQELVFFSWFFRQKPSLGTGGDYSMNETFEDYQHTIC